MDRALAHGIGADKMMDCALAYGISADKMIDRALAYWIGAAAVQECAQSAFSYGEK